MLDTRTGLTQEQIDAAAEIVQQVAAVPMLRGGYARFDYELNGHGWGDEISKDWSPVAVKVPSQPDRDRARAAVLEGIEQARQDLSEAAGGA